MRTVVVLGDMRTDIETELLNTVIELSRTLLEIADCYVPKTHPDMELVLDELEAAKAVIRKVQKIRCAG